MTPRHVLVVDDSPTGRHAATTLLQKRGYQVTTAVDGEDALEKIAAARPPVILLDIVLPKINGYQVLRWEGFRYETRKIWTVTLADSGEIVEVPAGTADATMRDTGELTDIPLESVSLRVDTALPPGTEQAGGAEQEDDDETNDHPQRKVLVHLIHGNSV